jgi:hypothetical protein
MLVSELFLTPIVDYPGQQIMRHLRDIAATW